jgi:hypothetical protein
MAFGLKGAPFTWCKIMSLAFAGIDCILIYFDDTVTKSMSIEDHFLHLEIVFDIIRKQGLKINPKKCVWFAKTIKILGHIVSFNEIRMDPDKVKIIVERPHPVDVTGVRSWLGSAGFYKNFIKNFSKLVVPLFNLLKHDVKFEWSTNCDIAFEQLKTAMISYPILRPADLSRRFYVWTDSSYYANGIIIGQRTDDNYDYVCAYDGQILHNSQINWTITEKELFAVYMALKKYRHFLISNSFTVITDHSSIKALFNSDNISKISRIFGITHF